MTRILQLLVVLLLLPALALADALQVAVAQTPTLMGTGAGRKQVIVKADSDNTNQIFCDFRSNVATSGVRGGFELAKGENLDISRFADRELYCIAGAASQNAHLWQAYQQESQ